MQFRAVMLVGIVLGSAAAASLSCSAPDPGEITYSERAGARATGQSPGGSSGGGASTSGSGGDGGTSGSTGGGGGDSGAVDTVFGDTVFQAGNPGLVANGADPMHNGNVEGQNCITGGGCHLDNGKPWGFAGTVYSAPINGQTVAGAEVRVVGPDGKLFGSTYSDANGNFWFESAGGARPPAGSRSGVRNAAKKNLMVATLPGGNDGAGCSGGTACHGGNANMRLYLQ